MKILNYFKKNVEAEKVGFNIFETAPDRAAKDLGKWRSAIQYAESGMMNRSMLYNLYLEQLDIDAHLQGILSKRTGDVLANKIQFSRNEKPDDKVNEWLESERFGEFLKDVQETIYWGMSLFSFEMAGKGWFDYYMVPRKHFNPHGKHILKSQYDNTGMSYAEMMQQPGATVLECGEPYELGLLKTLTYYSIAKRNVIGDWLTYSERAGNNFEQVKYQGGDIALRNQTLTALKNRKGGEPIGLPDGVMVDFKNGSSGSQNQLFENLTDTLNKEMSKLVLGNTMTTDDGSSRSQSETHSAQQDRILAADRARVLNFLNYNFIDYLPLWGINPQGGRFGFVEVMNTEQELDKDLKLKNLGYVFEPEYLAEKYGINGDNGK